MGRFGSLLCYMLLLHNKGNLSFDIILLVASENTTSFLQIRLGQHFQQYIHVYNLEIGVFQITHTYNLMKYMKKEKEYFQQ